MLHLFKTSLGRLRLLAFLEGSSLVVLTLVAVPLKYIWQSPGLAKMVGPVHGALFLLFVLNAVSVAIAGKWKAGTTWKVLLACFIPFGTFYIDRKILSRMHHDDAAV